MLSKISNAREISGHDELFTFGVLGGNNGLIGGCVVNSKIVHLVLEVILRANSEGEIVLVFLSNLEYTISPVVGPFDILLVVDCKVGNDQWMGEVLCRILGTNSNQSMAAGNDRMYFKL